MSTKGRPYSREIIRHAYDEALDALSRLSAFALSKSKGDGPVHNRQDRLALDDLVRFAIHARRLIQNTLGKNHFATAHIVQLKPLKGTIAVSEVLDAVIHNEDVTVVRSFFQYSLVSDPPANKEAAINRLAEHGHETSTLSPIIAVRSDRGLRCVVYVADLAETFESEILEKITEHCEKDHLFLDDFFNDL